jgi:hypothetical protein
MPAPCRKLHYPGLFKKTGLLISIYCLLTIALFASCKKTVHNAETRQIPKALVITTNMAEVAPDMKLMIRTYYESLPEAWYCKHYGSGAGTQAWSIQDTIKINNYNLPIYIPLRLGKKTYCPYILNAIYFSILQSPQQKPKPIISVWTKEENPGIKLKLFSSNLIVDYYKDTIGYIFPQNEKGLSHFQLPENVNDSLYVNLQFRIVKKG